MNPRMRGIGCVACALLATGCGDRELAPYGEAVFFVDTDLPVPKLAGRLRLDVYTEDGKIWYESREIALPDARDFPASFGVYDPDPDRTRTAIVRLRLFPQGKVRDYHGERFVARPAEGNPSDEPPVVMGFGDGPRLVVDGRDVTPPTEPQPRMTVDRLVRVRLEPGKVGAARVVLRGACMGTMADLADLRTCVDTEASIEPIADVALESEVSPAAGSVVGTFGMDLTCNATPRPATMAPDGTPLFDDEACVPGGSFIFGNADTFGSGARSGTPERIALVSPFRMDRFEVTVARYRHAIENEGFVSPDATPIANEQVIDAFAIFSPGSCTWSMTRTDRERFPLNCVSWRAARAFCQHLGGDLPTEVQWEYATQMAGRPVKTRYAWGDQDPTCSRAMFGHYGSDLLPPFSDQCVGTPPFPDAGPLGVDAFADPTSGDVSLGLGIVGLGASVAELVRDSFEALGSICWFNAKLLDPMCESTSQRSLRGGDWARHSVYVNGGHRDAYTETNWVGFIGFRCVRSSN